jgi:flagellar hook-basal body complex protein FliE
MIDPTFAINGTDGAEWQIGGVDAPEATQGSGSGSGFGGMLSDSIKSLEKTQDDAASASQALASGQATDPTAVVMAVERAQLSMQLAGQIRTKAVEAANEIFHTSV